MNRRRYFDKAAEDWDKTHHRETHDKLRPLISTLSISRGEFVLDLGCGSGILFPYILGKTGSQGKILGIDFSLRMLKEAKSRLLSGRGALPSANIFLSAADATLLPIQQGAFEVITCFGAFAHFEDKESSLSEIHRVLKPNGRVYIIHLLGREQLAQHHRQAGGPLANDTLPEKAEMERMLRKLGFKNIDVSDSPFLYLARAEKPSKN